MSVEGGSGERPIEGVKGLGDSNRVILAAQVQYFEISSSGAFLSETERTTKTQAHHALALSRLIAEDGSWLEAQELEGLIRKSSDAISHCVLVGTCPAVLDIV